VNKTNKPSGRQRYARKLATALWLVAGLHAPELWSRTGQVIDEETGKPLEKVFVMATWKGHVNFGVIGKTVCYDFAIIQTDKEGRFSLPDHSWNLNPFLTDRSRYVDFYRQGYKWSTSNMRDKNVGVSDDGQIMLKKFKGLVIDRLKELSTASYEECVSRIRTRATLLPLYIARYDEAQEIAITVEEKEQARFIKQLRDTVGLEPGALPRNPDGSIAN